MTGGVELDLQENEATKAASVSLHIAACAAQTRFPRAVKHSQALADSPNNTRLNVTRRPWGDGTQTLYSGEFTLSLLSPAKASSTYSRPTAFSMLLLT